MCSVPLDPLAVLWNVFGVEEFAGRRVLAEFVFAHRAAVHERLCDDRQARVDDVRLVNVEHKVGILDEVHPEPQRQTADTHAGVLQATGNADERKKSTSMSAPVFPKCQPIFSILCS